MAITINNPAVAATAASRNFVSVSWGNINTNTFNPPNQSAVYTVPAGKTFNGYITGGFQINGGSPYNAGSSSILYPVSLPAGTVIYNIRVPNPPNGYFYGYEE